MDGDDKKGWDTLRFRKIRVFVLRWEILKEGLDFGKSRLCHRIVLGLLSVPITIQSNDEKLYSLLKQ